MSPRTGRPVSGDAKKDAQVGFRVTKEIAEKFEVCSKISGKSKVELFEEMVNNLHEKLANKK